MNIFATSKCPIESAKALDDKRAIKMILESAQLLSTAIFLNSNQLFIGLYKPTHIKHPCTIWAAENKSNWGWLFDHLKALCEEYKFRYNKTHKTEQIITNLLKYRDLHIKAGKPTPFANCTKSTLMSIDYRELKDTHEAYKKYLSAKWLNDKIKPKWTKCLPPQWFINATKINYHSNKLSE